MRIFVESVSAEAAANGDAPAKSRVTFSNGEALIVLADGATVARLLLPSNDLRQAEAAAIANAAALAHKLTGSPAAARVVQRELAACTRSLDQLNKIDNAPAIASPAAKKK